MVLSALSIDPADRPTDAKVFAARLRLADDFREEPDALGDDVVVPDAGDLREVAGLADHHLDDLAHARPVRHLGDPGHHHADQLFERSGKAQRELFDRADIGRDRIRHDGFEDVLLGLEIEIQRALRDARGRGDAVGERRRGLALDSSLATLLDLLLRHLARSDREPASKPDRPLARRLRERLLDLNPVYASVGSIAGLLTIHDVALRKSEVELDMLRSMLSVCAWCRRIHDDDEGWIAMERYMTRHKGASLTHGICPECKAKTLAEMEAGH